MFGHRADGRKIKSLDPLFYAIPHLMPRRVDSMVFADMNIEMTELDRYVKEKRAECPDISHMTVIMAAMGRVMAEKPFLNRFIIGRRIYARKYISVCYNILTEFGPENPREDIIKLYYENGDDVFKVTKRAADAIKDMRETAAKAQTTSGLDRFLKLVFHLPTFMISGAIRFLFFLDRRGMLTKSLLDISPLHSSMYLTNMASLGMGSVKHHLYENGTVSLFLALGKREFTPVFDRDGLEKTKRTMNVTFTVDERVCSGYVFSRCLRLFEHYLRHPEELEQPTEIRQDVK